MEEESAEEDNDTEDEMIFFLNQAGPFLPAILNTDCILIFQLNSLEFLTPSFQK